ncbi:glutathione S-transferase family protein [Methylocapsa sp. S129]|uniref:glutathione S-transferase family protein n=1 Tax=Methylocapsa sp. S129 TaxID=1641869 RepID=UPI00131AC18F|nr:glutathione S-transferase family protein [Methylocapsa sp. S129]
MPTNEPALTLYSHPLASYCWKVLVALYETGTPFRSALIEGMPKAHPTLSGFWPIGKMPLLHDAARDKAVPETTIIIEYLQQYYPGSVRLIPEQPALQLDVRLWDRFFDLYVHTPMQKLVTDRMRPDDRKDPAGVDEARATLDTAYAMLEKRMAAQTWAVGDDFTLADCSAMPALFYAEAVHPFSETHPALARYFDRLTGRPSARRTIREAQPFFHWFPFHEALNPRFTSPDF